MGSDVPGATPGLAIEGKGKGKSKTHGKRSRQEYERYDPWEFWTPSAWGQSSSTSWAQGGGTWDSYSHRWSDEDWIEA